jgi:hypothetical protein
VTLNDFGTSGDVRITTTLSSGDLFVATGFPGSFGFNLKGNPTISVGGVSPGWSLLSPNAGSLHFDGFGHFDYALVCTACGNGGSSPVPPPLQFDVFASGLTIGSFAEGSTDGSASVMFAADIIGTNGNTGLVGGSHASLITESTTPIPEPATIMLFGSGLIAFARLSRRALRRPSDHSESRLPS